MGDLYVIGSRNKLRVISVRSGPRNFRRSINLESPLDSWDVFGQVYLLLFLMRDWRSALDYYGHMKAMVLRIVRAQLHAWVTIFAARVKCFDFGSDHQFRTCGLGHKWCVFNQASVVTGGACSRDWYWGLALRNQSLLGWKTRHLVVHLLSRVHVHWWYIMQCLGQDKATTLQCLLVRVAVLWGDSVMVSISFFQAID